MLDVGQRIFVDAYGISLGDATFKMHTKSAIELGRKIMEYLGANSLIFLEYERFVSLAEGIHLENAYKLGMEDNLK